MFHADAPITYAQDDQLNRNNFANLLAKSLINLKNEDTFTVGLYGKWGSGKTSIVNMALNEIDKEKKEHSDEKSLIVVRFEPWNFSNTEQLLTQFFVHLANELKGRSEEQNDMRKRIGKELDRYSDILNSSAFKFLIDKIPYGKIISLLAGKGMDFVAENLQTGLEDEDALKQKRIIADLIKNAPFRILIVIDDIDRLSSKQICQIFQLITVVAKFPKVTYLVVFDKDIVVKALEKVQEGSGEDYLEKVIQIPIEVPEPKEVDVRHVLDENLDNLFEQYPDLLWDRKYWNDMREECVDPFLKNIRDINRLCNSLEFKLAAISPEVNFVDLIVISVLQIHFPTVYAWVKTHRLVLTGRTSPESTQRELREQHIESQYKQSNIHEKYIAEIERLLELDTNRNGNVNRVEVEKILRILYKLFPYFEQTTGLGVAFFDKDKAMRTCRIAHSKKFERYFGLDLTDVSFSRKEIGDTINRISDKELKDFLIEKNEEGLLDEFAEELRAYTPQIIPDRIKLIIRTLLSVAHQIGDSFYPIRDVIVDLIKGITSDERYAFLSDCTKKADIHTLQIIAFTIYKIESGYGRVDTAERKEFQLVTLDELEQLEKQFVYKSEHLLQQHILFDELGWIITFALLEKLSPEYVEAYVKSAFNDYTNIVKYLGCSATGNRLIEITNEYKKYLTREQIYSAIDKSVVTGKLFSMSLQIQKKMAAFFLYVQRNSENNRLADENEVNFLLSAWKNQYHT